MRRCIRNPPAASGNFGWCPRGTAGAIVGEGPRVLAAAEDESGVVGRLAAGFGVEARLERDAVVDEPVVVVDAAVGVRMDLVGVGVGAARREQEALHVLGRVGVAARLLDRGAAAEVDEPARHRGRAATHGRGLQHQHVGAGLRRLDGGAGAGAPEPDHHDIGLVVPRRDGARIDRFGHGPDCTDAPPPCLTARQVGPGRVAAVGADGLRSMSSVASQGLTTFGSMDERATDPPESQPPTDDLAGVAPETSRGRRSWSAPVDAQDPDDLDRLVTELTAQARVRAAAVTAATAELVDAVAALRPHEGRLGVTWRRWVEWQLGLTTGEARRICCLAEKLPALPTIDAAFRAGELSEGVTEVLARVATPANEAEVMHVAAKVATGAQLQQIARDYRVVRDNAAGAAPDPADAPSKASWSWDDRGRFRGSWNLRPDDGATLEAALEAALAHLRPSETDIDHGRTAAAGEPTVVGGAAAIAEGELRPGERATARHSDALVALAEDALASEADDGLLPESTQVIVHRNIGPAGHVGPDGRVHVPGLPDLHAPPTAPVRRRRRRSRARRPIARRRRRRPPSSGLPPSPAAARSRTGWPTELACDSLTITVEMIAGFPVSEPTAVRRFNRKQRRALRARDRCCRFPGCTRTRHLHAHHTKPWHPNKRTTIADAVLLCGTHHGVVHRKGFTISLGVDFVITVTRPDGSILRSVPLPPPDPSVPRAVPEDPPPDRRRTGTGEPLTRYARDVLATSWHLAGRGGRGCREDSRSRCGPPRPATPTVAVPIRPTAMTHDAARHARRRPSRSGWSRRRLRCTGRKARLVA